MVSIRASFSVVRSSVTRIVALAKRESNRKLFGKFLNDHFRTGCQNTRRRTNHQVLPESLEPRHLMAAKGDMDGDGMPNGVDDYPTCPYQ